MTNRWDGTAIDYTDVDTIKAALVGKSIVDTKITGADYDRVISFALDDGMTLNAHAADGGCACSNGCFTVEPGNAVRGTITNVELKEVTSDYDYETGHSGEREIEPGSISDGSSVIRLFVYADLGEQVLVTSEGGDNGFYGWGFWLSVDAPNKQEAS